MQRQETGKQDAGTASMQYPRLTSAAKNKITIALA
jgi:hypothetical protein